jgi:hypothetical protein
MDLAAHAAKFPEEIGEYFHSSWVTAEIWRLDVPHTTLSIRELGWQLEWPFFSSNPPVPLFDLKPRTVLDNPHGYPKHWDRVLSADLAFPVHVSTFGGRVLIIDGFHRLIKSIAAGAVAIECKLVPRHHLYTAG